MPRPTAKSSHALRISPIAKRIRMPTREMSRGEYFLMRLKSSFVSNVLISL